MLLLEIGPTAPTEILLFAAGLTTTTKGPVVYDVEAGVMVLEAFQRRGLDRIPIDIAHGMLEHGGTTEQHKAFGWFKLRADETGLYATDIEWTDEGRALVESRAFRFFSPVILHDQASRVVEVINLALTNLPATNNQRPLVAERDPVKEQAIKLLSLAADASDEDITGAIVALQDEVLGLKAAARCERRDRACADLHLAGDELEFARALSDEHFAKFAAIRSAQRVTLEARIDPPAIQDAPVYTEQQLRIAKQLQRDPAACFPNAGKESK